MRLTLLALAALADLSLGGCMKYQQQHGAYVDHAEPSDFEPAVDDGKADGAGPTFNRNLLVSDDFFVDSQALDVAGIQSFLQDSLYGFPSWLAWETVDGVPVSSFIA